MKKMLFLACVICSFALIGPSNAWSFSSEKLPLWENVFPKYFGGHNTETKAVVFYQRRARQIPEPIIEEETLEMAEKIIFSPLAMIEKYNHLTLLILTNILLVLTVTRRKQMEKAQRIAAA